MDLSQLVGSMNSPDESLQQEVRRGKESLLRPKVKIRLGAWNVCTMFETSKAAQVIGEISRYKLDILGISECLMRARFNSKHCKLTIIQCYAPTNEAKEKDKDDWYE